MHTYIFFICIGFHPSNRIWNESFECIHIIESASGLHRVNKRERNWIRTRGAEYRCLRNIETKRPWYYSHMRNCFRTPTDEKLIWHVYMCVCVCMIKKNSRKNILSFESCPARRERCNYKNKFRTDIIQNLWFPCSPTPLNIRSHN